MASATDTGMRTVRVRAVNVGSWLSTSGGPVMAGAVGVSRGAGGAAGFSAGAARRTATTSVSVAPASRSAASRGASRGSDSPRVDSSVRIVVSLMPAWR